MKANDLLTKLRLALISLIGIVLLLVPARSSVAQSPDPQKPTSEVQLLKERLLQLEQTVEQLKSQISTVEDTQKKTSTVETGVATGERIAAAMSSAPAAPKAQDNGSRGE